MEDGDEEEGEIARRVPVSMIADGFEPAGGRIKPVAARADERAALELRRQIKRDDRRLMMSIEWGIIIAARLSSGKLRWPAYKWSILIAPAYPRPCLQSVRSRD